MALDETTFRRAMNRLKLLPTQGGFEDETQFAARKIAYFEALQDLDSDRFAIACQRLFGESGRVWFPTPGEIRAEAEAWTPVLTREQLARQIVEARPTPEQLEAGKAEAAKGLALAKAAVKQRLKGLPPEPATARPKERRAVVEYSDERRDELRRQAAEITEPDGDREVCR